MNEFIKQLSKDDKKTLSQKALKLTEEVGELARVILPYDSAHGTNHRFVDKEAILEEIADVYLSNISIAYSLDISQEEIENMILEKSKKWSKIQAQETAAPFPLPYEIHITVENDLKRYAEFKELCEKIGVKPIVLDLEMNDGVLKDIMTSSKHFGDNKSAYLESKRILNELFLAEFKVKRNKIETVPWHPAAPTEKTGAPIPNGCYFESHIGVIIEESQKEELLELVEGLNKRCTLAGTNQLGGIAKLSRNFFKKMKDGVFVNMLTYRDNMTNYKQFEYDVEVIKSCLEKEFFEFQKVEVEYSIYDTNVAHDKSWLLGESLAGTNI
jgi:NTP pyrophosphatase (non-canonical NTP hydrolase)